MKLRILLLAALLLAAPVTSAQAATSSLVPSVRPAITKCVAWKISYSLQRVCVKYAYVWAP